MIDELNRRKRKYGITRFIIWMAAATISFGFFMFFMSPDVDDGDGFALFAFGLIFLFSTVFAIIILIRSRISVEKTLVKFCDGAKSPASVMVRLEKVWQSGTDVKYGRVDNEYLVALVNLTVYVFPLQNAVWIYGERSSVNFIPTSSVLYVHYKEGKKQRMSFSGFRSKYLDMMLSCIFEFCPHIYVGNDFQIGKLYKEKNWQELSRYAQMQRQA